MSRFSRFCLCLFSLAAVAPVALTAQTPTFAAPKQLSLTPDFYLAGNFNGNGNTDLIDVVFDPNSGANNYEFLAGDGVGDFPATGPIVTLPSQNVALVADANGDGKDDIITLLAGCQALPCADNSDPTNERGIFTVLLSQGNGKFTQGYVGTLPAGLGNVEAVVGDFNKDGKPDIAVLAYAYGPSYRAPAQLCIFLNQGNGTFTQTDYQTPDSLGTDTPSPTNLVIGDFEGNGNQDIAVAFESANGAPIAFPEILTFAGNGKGAFGPGVLSYTLDSRLSSPIQSQSGLFAGDLNGDGRTDLLTGVLAKPPNQATGNVRVPSLLANTSGKFFWSSAVSLSSQSGQNILLSDFNGDGKPDLFFITGHTNTAPGPAGFYLGLGNGTFQTPHIPFAVKGVTELGPSVVAIRLKTGDLPSILVDGYPLVLFVNTTKK